MIPHTVPKSPINGAVEPTDAKKFIFWDRVFSSLSITMIISLSILSQKFFLNSAFFKFVLSFIFSKYDTAEKNIDSNG